MLISVPCHKCHFTRISCKKATLFQINTKTKSLRSHVTGSNRVWGGCGLYFKRTVVMAETIACLKTLPVWERNAPIHLSSTYGCCTLHDGPAAAQGSFIDDSAVCLSSTDFTGSDQDCGSVCRVLLHVQEAGEDRSQWDFNLRPSVFPGGEALGGCGGC